jgi:hypothetical protein
VISDFRVIGDQQDLFGLVAVAGRCLAAATLSQHRRHLALGR